MKNSSILKYFNRVPHSVIVNLPLFTMYWVLLCLPIYPAGEVPIIALMSCLLRNFFIAIALTYLSDRKWLKMSISLILAIFFFVEFYCKIQQGCRLNESMLFLVMQSNPQESAEYLTTFFFTLKTLFAFGITIVILALGYILNHLWQNINVVSKNGRFNPFISCLFWMMFGLSLADTFTSSKPSTIGGLFLSIQLLGMLMFPFIVLLWAYIISNKRVCTSKCKLLLSKWIPYILVIIVLVLSFFPELLIARDRIVTNVKILSYPPNTIQQFVRSWILLYRNKDNIPELTETCKNIEISGLAYSDVMPFKVVVVIGESYNPTHSQIYGYCLPTTPYLMKQNENGNLVLFSDAITRAPSTSYVIHESFSTWSLTDSAKWEKFPILPAVIKRAGYRVALIDNQNTRFSEDHASFSVSAFFSTKEMDELCFDMRNDTTFPYDGELIDKYLPKYFNADFTLIHLMGQHIDAKERYPQNYDRFKVDDYDFKDGYSDAQKQVIAHYDNATLYNDYVLNRIFSYYSNVPAIIIYFADHGEEIYDFRDNYGRNEEPIFKELLPHLYHIPYMIWMSNSFIDQQPKIAQKVEEMKDKPIINSDISHVVLDLMGISTPTLDLSHSYLNDAFEYNEPRLLKVGSKYESLLNDK